MLIESVKLPAFFAMQFFNIQNRATQGSAGLGEAIGKKEDGTVWIGKPRLTQTFVQVLGDAACVDEKDRVVHLSVKCRHSEVRKPG